MLDEPFRKVLIVSRHGIIMLWSLIFQMLYTDFADVAIFQGSQISSCSTNFTRPASFSFHPPFLNFSAPRNMSNLKRGWMYERLDGRGGILSSFITGVNNFIQYACSQKNRMSGDNIKCPCKKCHNLKYMDVEMVKYHLFQYGFVENYFVWKYQGEEDAIDEMYYVNDLHGGTQPELGYDNPYRQMVLDVAGSNFDQGIRKVTELDAEEVNRRICKSCGWKKQSIFWDLPYWSSNMIRHNLDVMHIEKNVFDNVFNTVLNIVDKTKDNSQSRLDMVNYCDRPQLAKDSNGKYPKAVYTIDKEEKAILFNWVKDLKFPDGYVSNLGRCPDTNTKKLYGMKSHDCHVFMQRLLPIAFRELLPSNVWQALTELSLFFKDLTSTTLRVDDMERLEADIPQILCKLERIFPPGFFDSMEHLPVHLPYEAKIAGPVQYRWMYPFERFSLKFGVQLVILNYCDFFLFSSTAATSK
ncbi:hypothetical protein MTR67_013093, partial [Solanum verrucosum]